MSLAPGPALGLPRTVRWIGVLCLCLLIAVLIAPRNRLPGPGRIAPSAVLCTVIPSGWSGSVTCSNTSADVWVERDRWGLRVYSTSCWPVRFLIRKSDGECVRPVIEVRGSLALDPFACLDGDPCYRG